MYDRYKGYPDVRYGHIQMWRRTHLVELDKLLPLILSNAAARLEPPDLNPISGENTGRHSIC